MKSSNLPRYIVRSNEQAFAPPYLQAGCKLYGFWLRAAGDRLQSICDRFFYQPSGGALQVRIAAPWVLLYFCSFARTQSLHEIDRERGWLGENECGLWIPVTYVAGIAPPCLAFFPFAMFVDSGPAAISGREVLGFPKEIGHITLPIDSKLPALLALDGLTFARHERNTAGGFSRLIEVRMEPKTPRGKELAIAGAPALVFTLLRALRSSRGLIRLLLLKQIRDAITPELACHQSVLACTPQSVRLHALRLLPRLFRCDFHACASHPFVEEMGIESTSLRASRGFFIDFDFTLGQVERLWEAT